MAARKITSARTVPQPEWRQLELFGSESKPGPIKSARVCQPHGAPAGPGVYRILCLTSGKFYIGSAASVRTRWHVHLHHLRAGTHVNRHLLNAWRKYGEESFCFEVLETPPVAELTVREQHYLDLTGCCDPGIGYNQMREAASTVGYRHTEEYRLRKSKVWVVTDPDGREIEVRNLKAFAKARGLGYKALQAVADARFNQTQGGWLCRRASQTRKEWQAKRQQKREACVGRIDCGGLGWIVTPPGEEPRYVKALKPYCRERGLNFPAMISVASCRLRQHRGYFCRRKDEPETAWLRRRLLRVEQGKANQERGRALKVKGKPWVVTFPDGHEETVRNLSGFCRAHNLGRVCMQRVVDGERQHHKGFRCRPANL